MTPTLNNLPLIRRFFGVVSLPEMANLVNFHSFREGPQTSPLQNLKNRFTTIRYAKT